MLSKKPSRSGNSSSPAGSNQRSPRSPDSCGRNARNYASRTRRFMRGLSLFVNRAESRAIQPGKMAESKSLTNGKMAESKGRELGAPSRARLRYLIVLLALIRAKLVAYPFLRNARLVGGA